MSEKDTKNQLADDRQSTNVAAEKIEIENLVEDFKIRNVSSDEMIKAEKSTAESLSFAEDDEDVNQSKPESSKPDEINLSENEIEVLLEKSPVFKELAEPKLRALPKENRARLQMQSPTRLYFYWSIKNNPFQTFNRAFGANAGNYTLVAKLVDKAKNHEEIVPVETEGSTWFDVDADSTYRIEIGFYAANHPFVRVMFSNTVETPRKNPSPRNDFSSDWSVSANQFAQVLDASGYGQDAAEVALAGDDFEVADAAARAAFSEVVGERENYDFAEDYAKEIRFVLLALASGYALENLRGQISKSLFAKLQKNIEKLSAEKALDALQKNFGEYADETIEENFEQTVIGASSINFPRFSRRKVLPKFSPLSSFSLNN